MPTTTAASGGVIRPGAQAVGIFHLLSFTVGREDRRRRNVGERGGHSSEDVHSLDRVSAFPHQRGSPAKWSSDLTKHPFHWLFPGTSENT